ncbi:MAG TPA: YceH family protein [Thermoanaerobaculia bacterium]|nr:YceH family protein [Thermoanaerobaculia bacterium]
MALTRKLDLVEERVLGALMEKERATPDQYPLTLNALVSACNQKSNREPVMELGSGVVWDALERLRRDVLVWRSEGARTDRFEHRLTSRWKLDRQGQAVMTLLLLRGPQTPGELRSRSGRLHDFGAVGEVEATLERLTEGPDPLVEELPRQPGQRESRWRHVMGDEEAAPEPPVAAPAPGSGAPSTRAEPDRLRAVAEPAGEQALDSRIAELEETVRRLEERLSRLEADLL